MKHSLKNNHTGHQTEVEPGTSIHLPFTSNDPHFLSLTLVHSYWLYVDFH